MEIILAIVVASAVIFFGALISMGNERQRKAIDGLREQLVLWAVQDLKIKHEHLAQTVQVHDPLHWLSQVSGRMLGQEVSLQILEAFQETQSIVCADTTGDHKIIFTTLSPIEIKKLAFGRQAKLSNFATGNPLLSLPKRVVIHEFSILSCGFLFDLEFPLAWIKLTGWSVEKRERLWMYLIP
ncbi:MAG: hypothetical protein HY864_10355 [Chloroflexi bacterium]|jgi:hypothetical protein|nr:hypothetical protein [Chloroflexota bacterium]